MSKNDEAPVIAEETASSPAEKFKLVVKSYPRLYGFFSRCKRVIYTIIGFFRWHIGEPKTIVLVFSSMRAGSTLLKSLMGEAKDVSLIDEFNFLPYADSNKYLFYGLVSSLAKEPIVVLKKPFNNNLDHLAVYGLSPMPSVKRIVLYRNPYDTLCSLRKLQEKRHKSIFSDKQLVDYWCDSYESVLENTRGDEVLVVKYEELTTEPKNTTRKIFVHIQSECKEGVDQYSEYDWVGGKDDASDNIRGLRVADAKQNSQTEQRELYQMLENSERVQALWQRLDSKKT